MSKLSVVSCIWSQLETKGSIPCRRSGHAIVVCENEIYMFGGSHYQKAKDGYVVRFLNDMHCLPTTNEYLKWGAVTQYHDIPGPRDSHTFSLIDNKLVLFGGKNAATSGESLKGVFEFTPDTKKWKSVVTTGNQPLTIGHSASIFGNSVFIFGGLINGRATDWLHEYNSDTKSWKTIETCGPSPSPRCDHTSEIVNGMLYIFGGVSKINVCLNDLHTFDIVSETWSQPNIRGLPPTPRCSHTFVAHRDKDIYIFGGWLEERGKHKILRGLRKLSVGNQKWKNIYCAGDEPPLPRYGHCATICHSKMYIIGGMEINGEAVLDKLHVLRLINPSERRLVLSHALKDIEDE